MAHETLNELNQNFAEIYLRYSGDNWLGFEGHRVKGQGHAATAMEIL